MREGGNIRADTDGGVGIGIGVGAGIGVGVWRRERRGGRVRRAIKINNFYNYLIK
jgi:hypothetical protein